MHVFRGRKKDFYLGLELARRTKKRIPLVTIDLRKTPGGKTWKGGSKK